MLWIRKSKKSRVVGAIWVIGTVALMGIGATAGAGSALGADSTTQTAPAPKAAKAVKITTAKTALAAASYAGCDSGWVCLYAQDAPWPGSNPTQAWFAYGAYNLREQYGWHWIFNNQTGGAKAKVCKGVGGGGPCSAPLEAGWAYLFDFTPINSVTLTPR